MKAGIILDKDVPKKQKPNIEKTEDPDRPTHKKSIKTITSKNINNNIFDTKYHCKKDY